MGRRRTTILKELEESVPELSWEEGVGQFLDSLKVRGLAYHTRRWHRENLQTVEKVMKETGYTTKPGLVTENMLQEVILKMIDAGLSPTTINHRVRSLKQFYQYLNAEALVANNPAQRIARKKAPLAMIETFTEDQLEALLAVTDKTRFVGYRDYAIMLLLLDTGIRLKELVGIKLEDLRLSVNEIIITEAKGGRQRRVFVSPKTKEALKKYLRIRGGIQGNNYLFVTNENNPMKRRNVQERLRIYGRKANIEGVRVSPHTFRHTFAKLYIMRGGDPFSLQAILGHSTLDMVRRYVNLWGSDLQKMHRQYSPVNYLVNREKGGRE